MRTMIAILFAFLAGSRTLLAFDAADSPYRGVWEVAPNLGMAIAIRTNGVVEGNLWDPEYARLVRLKGCWRSQTNGHLLFEFAQAHAPDSAELDPDSMKLKVTWTTHNGRVERTFRRGSKLSALERPNLRESPSVRSNVYPVSKRALNARIEDDEICVAVFGHVQYPGLYYCRENADVFELIRLCRPGGGAGLGSVAVQRRVGARLHKIQVKAGESTSFSLKDGDVIDVGYLLFDDRFYSVSEE